jgi:ferredoxin
MTDIARVKAGVDFNQYEAQIKQSAADCPTAVIKVS